MRRAFTLIELLVVITIIAILAAILFPVFAQAKESAKATTCLSNMKQVGLGTMMYANDDDGVYPAWASLAPPVNGGNTSYVAPDTQVMPYVRSNQIWRCPDDTLPRPPASAVIFNNGDDRKRALPRSYVYVGNIITGGSKGKNDLNTGISYWVGPGSWKYAGRSESMLTAPSEMVCWAEQWVSNPSDSFVGGIWGSGFIDCNTSKLAGRSVPAAGPDDQAPSGCTSDYKVPGTPGHRKRGHYIFADGHAAAKTWGWIRQGDFDAFRAVRN